VLVAALDGGVTEIDTAFNYSGFAAHRLLAEAGRGLLDRFSITTKVGFFADGHDLTAARLSEAVERISDQLGRVPDTLLLHNPERSAGQFSAACEALIGLRDRGFCTSWGFSTWNPRPLLGVAVPESPDVVMVRCGLAVPHEVLGAAEQLVARLRPSEVRGMSPFGGSAADPVWAVVDPTLFLVAAEGANQVQAAFAMAFAVPEVPAVAVGTSRPEHLRQLLRATRLEVRPEVVAQYRALLGARA
jgi:aryl-alcohol dehydrogenase-like predicted oxidoreductase